MSSLVENCPVALEKKILEVLNLFYYFPIISPLWRLWPFIWTNLNPLYPRMPCAKFGWNWLIGSGKEDKNEKILQQNENNNGQWIYFYQKCSSAFGSGELKWELLCTVHIILCHKSTLSEQQINKKWCFSLTVSTSIVYIGQNTSLTSSLNVACNFH